MELDPLSRLRDVILPADPGIWPPAIGWWLLPLFAAAAIVGIIHLMRVAYRHHRATSPIDEIDKLVHLTPQQAVVELSILMRRIAMTKFSRDRVAGLSDEAWLEFLDQSGNTDQFTRGPGRALTTWPYSAVPAADGIEPLFEVCRNWAKVVNR